MEFRVEISRRAARDLQLLYTTIEAFSSQTAGAWFNGIERTVHSLARTPKRGRMTAEDQTCRQILYGRKPYVYRIIYKVDDTAKVVYVLHVRHGARDAFISPL